MNPHKQLVLQALYNMKGDDLYRAQSAFRGMTCEQMQQQHGESGKTRQQVLDGYAAYEQKVIEAIRWVEGLA